MQILKPVLMALLLSMYLGLSDGHLAIYRVGCPEPLKVLPYDAAIFTAADRQALAAGIPFSTDAEMSRLLEDFTS